MLRREEWPPRSDGMDALVMFRWVMPVLRPYGSARELIGAAVSPAVRSSGWLSSPGTTHHLCDQDSEVWVTVITRVDDATDVEGEMADLLHARPRIETAHDALLTPDSHWYRSALQHVSSVGLDLIEARADLPLSEYEAFEDPTDAAPLLTRYLSGVSDSYRRTCSTYEKTESFWLSFFRRGPAPYLPRPGRGLWNLAG